MLATLMNANQTERNAEGKTEKFILVVSIQRNIQMIITTANGNH
jgi:hypothetical protein